MREITRMQQAVPGTGAQGVHIITQIHTHTGRETERKDVNTSIANNHSHSMDISQGLGSLTSPGQTVSSCPGCAGTGSRLTERPVPQVGWARGSWWLKTEAPGAPEASRNTPTLGWTSSRRLSGKVTASSVL